MSKPAVIDNLFNTHTPVSRLAHVHEAFPVLRKMGYSEQQIAQFSAKAAARNLDFFYLTAHIHGALQLSHAQANELYVSVTRNVISALRRERMDDTSDAEDIAHALILSIAQSHDFSVTPDPNFTQIVRKNFQNRARVMSDTAAMQRRVFVAQDTRSSEALSLDAGADAFDLALDTHHAQTDRIDDLHALVSADVSLLPDVEHACYRLLLEMREPQRIARHAIADANSTSRMRWSNPLTQTACAEEIAELFALGMTEVDAEEQANDDDGCVVNVVEQDVARDDFFVASQPAPARLCDSPREHTGIVIDGKLRVMSVNEALRLAACREEKLLSAVVRFLAQNDVRLVPDAATPLLDAARCLRSLNSEKFSEQFAVRLAQMLVHEI